MTEVIMPKMGDGMEEGTLLEWLKKDGDTVKSGEIIGTIQTDKATLELEAPGSGVLTGFLLTGGETVPVGKAIAAILKAGDKLPADWGSGAAKPASEAPVVATAVSTPSVAAETASTDRVKASPLAKKIAREKGINLATVTGSGPNGRIVERDLQNAKASAPAAAPVIAAKAEDKLVPLNRLRQITAQRTLQSKQQVPHFYVTVAVDVERMLDIRVQLADDPAGKVSVNDFVIKACALALREMPGVNSTYQGDKLLQFGAVNIGMAIALDDGLTVAVIHNADQLSIRQIGAKSRELAGKARDNKLHPDELSGSTFSISNMGMLDVDVFSAIINQPNAAILAVGTAKKVVVAGANDEIEIRSQMNITCSFDHRVVDGAVGAKFTNLVKSYLENPARLLA
ncbi:MAG: dihydrolipoamide acetyltransferase family protein [Fimbriimonadaceae bacterium]